MRVCGGGGPRNSEATALGWNSPPRIESSVLLPQPEGPTIATTSPDRTVNDTSSSTSSAPKRWVIWSAIRSIGGSVFLLRHAQTIPVILRKRALARVSKDDGHHPGRSSFEARPAVQVHRKARTSG